VGRRPRDWDQAWVESLTAGEQRIPYLVSGYLHAYAHALDRGDIERAGNYLDRAGAYADRVPAKQLGSVFSESAYFEARHRNNATKAREYLSRAAGLSRPDPYAIPRCQAAVLLVEGRYDEAEQALAEAKSALSHIGQTGDALAEWDLVRDLERQVAIRRGHESGETLA
jgi:tetratricopeptide (TPR) repeat protein